MEELGLSLDDLFKICGESFELKMICLIAIKMIETLEILHSLNIVH